MIFLGLEKPVEYQRQLIFDPTMALMVFNALRDYFNAVYNDYQQGLSELKEFNKEFGTFDSPIIADNDNYYNLTMGGIKKMFDDANAAGVDLLRSPEGRRMVLLYINTRPYGDLAKLRQSSESAKLYLKAKNDLISKGLYDPDFESFRLNGKGLENWNTLGQGLVWNETSPALFKDLNTWTHHLFDNMELSYDPELSKKYPGYMAYTKSRDTMGKIVDNNIAQLLNTDLGKYYLQDALSLIPDDFLGDRRKEALRILKENVINSNWEEGQVELKTDPYALAKHQALMLARYSPSSRKSSPDGSDASYNYLVGLFRRGITAPFGYDAVSLVELAADNMIKNQLAFGQSVISDQRMGTYQAYKSKAGAYLGKFTLRESPIMFASAITRPAVNKLGAVYMSPDDIKYLYSAEDVVTHTYGYPNRAIDTDRKKITTPVVKYSVEGDLATYRSSVIMQPLSDVYIAYDKNGLISAKWKILLQNEETGDVFGDYYYKLPISSEHNLDIPGIDEWRRDGNGKFFLPKDNRGNERGMAKIGVDPREAGHYETSSLSTSKELGVTKHMFDRNSNFAEESITIPFAPSNK